jgi:hypothetical protein
MKALDWEFFATRRDQLPNLLRLEATVKLQYALEGMFEQADPTIYQSAADIPQLGVAVHGDYHHEPSYLVLAARAKVRVKEEPQKAGGTLHAVDLRLNRTAFCYQPAGAFDRKTIICGSVGTAGGLLQARALCKQFWQALRQGFVQVGRYHVGPEAYRLLERGGRLTPSLQCPPYMNLPMDP